MAGPITWRNVRGTASASNAVDLFGESREAMNDSLGSLRDVLKGYQDTNRANFRTGQQNRAADYLDRVAQARSVEELNALRENPDVQGLRQGLTAEFRNQTRGALDTREGNIIDQTTARQKFGDAQHNRDLRDDVQALQVDAYNGDRSAQQRLLELGYRDNGETLKSLQSTFESGRSENRAQGRYGMETVRHSQNNWRFGNEVEDRGILEDERALEKRIEDMEREAALSLETAPDEATATDLRRALFESILGTGGDVASATSRAGNVDSAWTSYAAPSAMDVALNDQEQAVLDRKYDAAGNQYIQAYNNPVQDAGIVAGRLLDKHRDEKGRPWGTSDPEEALEFARQATAYLREPIEVDGIEYYVDENDLTTALNGVGENLLDFDVEGALKDVIKNEPGYKEKGKALNQYIKESGELSTRQAKQTLPMYLRRRLPEDLPYSLPE